MSINFLRVKIWFVKPSGKLVRFMFVRVEYDRSNRVCIYEGQVIGLPMQSIREANLSTGARLLWPPHWRRRWTLHFAFVH